MLEFLSELISFFLSCVVNTQLSHKTAWVETTQLITEDLENVPDRCRLGVRQEQGLWPRSRHALLEIRQSTYGSFFEIFLARAYGRPAW